MAVSDVVKKFLEENIKQVNNPRIFFNSWCIEMLDCFDPAVYFNELYFVLKQINIDILRDTEDVRKELVVDMFRRAMKRYKKTQTRTSFSQLARSVPCELGFDKDTIHELADEAARQENLIIAPQGYYVR